MSMAFFPLPYRAQFLLMLRNQDIPSLDSGDWECVGVAARRARIVPGRYGMQLRVPVGDFPRPVYRYRWPEVANAD